MKRRICIIAEDYPDTDQPNYPFVQELAYSLSNEGMECSVIAPQSLTKAVIRRLGIKKRVSSDINPEGKEIKVFRPYTVTFSNTRNNSINQLTFCFFRKAVQRALNRIGKTDYVYCYFWHIGLATAKALLKSELPLFVQASECDIDVIPSYRTAELLNRVSGVVCASRKNYDESIDAGFINEKSNTIIVPNGFRRDEFYPIDKSEVRKRLNIDKDQFVVAFVGDFNERKGSARLSKAIDQFDDVYSIFIGVGDKTPSCKNVLFQGTVPHNELVYYLNCADVFVLPTQAEGCCNAIIEAVACGLPVISSNKSFNDEILDESYSIRINENSIDEIADAIRKLKNNAEMRKAMSLKALEASRNLSIEKRAKAIASFLSGIQTI